MSQIYALLIIIIGLSLALSGYRLARFVIPLWGFLAGFSVGGAVTAALSNTPFIGTTLGIIVGLVSGLVLAVFAYLYYSAAVIVTVGSIGYWIGSSFMLMLGLSTGVITMLAGLTIGIIVGGIALALDAPKYFLIGVTSLAGAITTVGGVMLLFNVIPLESFNYSVAHAAITDSFIWTLVALGVFALSVIWQYAISRTYELEHWTYEQMNPTGHSGQPPIPSH